MVHLRQENAGANAARNRAIAAARGIGGYVGGELEVRALQDYFA